MNNTAANGSGAPAWADWRGRRVAFLGDSITDAAHHGCTVNYWGVLERDTGLVPIVLGLNGAQWRDLPDQVRKLSEERGGAVDAIFIFAGTNDFNASVPLGDWFERDEATVDRGHGMVTVGRRKFRFDETTFRGRVNRVMSAVKEGWPDADVFLLTPIHRGYAKFGPENVQPDESHANEAGLFIDDYVAAVKEAGNLWAACVIDIHAESGLFPLHASHSVFFHDARSDLLHPGDRGHERIARAIERHLGMAAATASQVVAQPASFAAFDARARAGERLTIVFFGGSLTWSANATEPNRTGFRGLVADWFAETYPDAHFTFVDAAIGGTGSLLGMFRLDRDVLAKKPDLVFLDFSCNDGWNRENDLENLTAACAYESLLRRMTGAGVPVVQMFFTFREWIAGVLAGKDPDEAHRRRTPYLRLAEPYGTAVGDIYRDSSMLADLRAGKTSIDVLWPIDGGHPDDPGYRYFAEAGIAGYRRAVAEGVVGRVPETPLYGTAEDLRRADAAALASAPHPAAWTPRLAYRTSLWYDGLSSRWMDGVLAFGGVERAPLAVRAKGNLFGIFGEADENALVAEIRADDKPVATFNGYHNAGKGRLFIWRHAALPGWEKGESVERAFEIDPAPKAETAGEFRIGSVCTATLLPSQSGVAYFSGVSDSSAAAGDDVETIDHARGK